MTAKKVKKISLTREGFFEKLATLRKKLKWQVGSLGEVRCAKGFCPITAVVAEHFPKLAKELFFSAPDCGCGATPKEWRKCPDAKRRLADGWNVEDNKSYHKRYPLAVAYLNEEVPTGLTVLLAPSTDHFDVNAFVRAADRRLKRSSTGEEATYRRDIFIALGLPIEQL